MPVPRDGRAPQAPPPAPPVEIAPQQPGQFNPSPPPEGSTPYSIGSPTDEEQLYLEYLNRARANPPAEGARLAATTDPDVLASYAYFGVDLTMMQTQFDALLPAPPLAVNAQLTAAARWHSGDMFTNQYQGHNQTNNGIVTTPGDRIKTNGYNWYTYGENVYSYADSVFYGHAGFEVDWGYGTGGMQVPPGHRLNIHNPSFREAGVGVVDGSNGPVGPQLVTQDLATRQSATPLITGVVYYDLNGNGFYDVGEGIGGVTVQVPGSAYFAVTANSGGYAVPVTTNGNYAMSFSASGLSAGVVATVITQANVKADYVPAYSPPVVSGPNPAALNENNAYSFTPVGAATNHQWEQTWVAPFTTVEGAENGLGGVTAVTSAGYAVIVSDVVASGSHAFHLAQPDASDQFLALNQVLLPRTNSQLRFAKRLGWATSGQVARAQISTNGGASWQDVWSQAGNGSSTDGSFVRITNSLGACAGLPLRIRFAYDYVGGSYYPQTDSFTGLGLDDIAVSNAEQVQDPVTQDVPSGTTFVFHPANTGDCLLGVRAQLPGRTLPWGPALRVTVTNLPAMTIGFTGFPMLSGGQFQADFDVANYRLNTPFRLLVAPAPGATWTTDNAASFQTLIPNARFRVVTTNGGDQGYYRIQAD